MTEQVKPISDRKTTAVLSIRINFGHSIRMHKNVFDILGCPDYLHFWWGEDEKVLAVSASSEPTNYSVTVPDCFNHHKNGYRLRSPRLRNTIKSKIGWGDIKVINLIGEFEPDSKMVIFRIRQDKAEERFHD